MFSYNDDWWQCDAQSHALVIGKSLVCTSVKQEEF